MKQSDSLSLKLDPETKRKLHDEALKREWTVSHMARHLLITALNSSERVLKSDSCSDE